MTDVFQIKAINVGFEGKPPQPGTLVVRRKGSDVDEEYAVPLAHDVTVNEGNRIGFRPAWPEWAQTKTGTITLDPKMLVEGRY